MFADDQRTPISPLARGPHATIRAETSSRPDAHHMHEDPPSDQPILEIPRNGRPVGRASPFWQKSCKHD